MEVTKILERWTHHRRAISAGFRPHIIVVSKSHSSFSLVSASIDALTSHEDFRHAFNTLEWFTLPSRSNDARDDEYQYITLRHKIDRTLRLARRNRKGNYVLLSLPHSTAMFTHAVEDIARNPEGSQDIVEFASPQGFRGENIVRELRDFNEGEIGL